MSSMKKTVTADEARDILLSLSVQRETETLSLRAARGRVLAENVTASVPMPPFDRSPFDGYAVRWEDTANAAQSLPAVLRIVEELPAGTAPTETVGAGMAAKILTGAPIPAGADSVIKFEETERDGGTVRIFAPLKPCQNVIYRGEELEQGAVLLEQGALLAAPELGMLAAQGRERCAVYKRPTAALFTTGSELTPPGVPLEPGKIYDSNNAMLAAMLEEAGFDCLDLGAVEDDAERIAARLEQALEQADIVITTGGASVGDYDFAHAAVERVGAEVLFRKISMKPGSCVVAAVKGNKHILSLSGNPGAAAVCLLRVAMPYLKRQCGRCDVLPEEIVLPLKEAVRKASPVTRLLRGRLEITDGRAVFAENPRQGNGMIASLRGFELLGEIPAGSPPLEAGTLIKAYRF